MVCLLVLQEKNKQLRPRCGYFILTNLITSISTPKETGTGHVDHVDHRGLRAVKHVSAGSRITSCFPVKGSWRIADKGPAVNRRRWKS